MKIQNYGNYRLPITSFPLEYGKIIDQTGNKFTIYLPTGNILIIQANDKDNYIKLFRNGELALEFKDSIIDDTTFSRLIEDTKFTFVDGKLERTEILLINRYVSIFDKKDSDTNSINLKSNTPNTKRSFSTSAINSVKHPGNIVKLRRKKGNA
jgi:hypothetical protein